MASLFSQRCFRTHKLIVQTIYSQSKIKSFNTINHIQFTFKKQFNAFAGVFSIRQIENSWPQINSKISKFAQIAFSSYSYVRVILFYLTTSVKFPCHLQQSYPYKISTALELACFKLISLSWSSIEQTNYGWSLKTKCVISWNTKRAN